MSAIQQLLTDHIDIWTAAETEKKSGRGRASGNAGSVYGIRKLRELILELAVRGKLVPQDANDEPASELLKRIQAEKAKLIAEGKIKKDKPLAAIEDEEKPFDLPSGWEWANLPDVSDYKVGKTPSTKSNAYWTNSDDGFDWVSIADLNHDGIVFETNRHITAKAVSEIFRSDPAPAGTILMSFKLTLGKTSILDKPAFHNEAIISIYPYRGIFKDFLFKVLPARAMAGNSKSAIKGNTLNSESIAALMIPLPPLAEQHRIVEKVDALMALCDQLENQHSNAAEAHEKLISHLLGTLTQSKNADDFSANWQRIAAHFDTLFIRDASIDALKQTLLQLAVMGKLVPQDANDEPASELIKRIQAEKAKLIAEGKIKKDKPLTPITDDEKPFELPKNWLWVRMGDICRPISSGSTPPAESFQYEDGIPYLKVYNIKNQEVDFDYKKQFVDESYHATKLKRSVIYPGELIMNIVGPPLGKVAIVPSSHPEWNCNQAIVFFGLIKPMSPHYVLDFLKEGSFLNDIELIGTAGQDNISVTKSKNIPVPIPPLAEQHRIVTKVDELMALCDQLKSRITDASRLQQKLADVLVEQAVA